MKRGNQENEAEKKRIREKRLQNTGGIANGSAEMRRKNKKNKKGGSGEERKLKREREKAERGQETKVITNERRHDGRRRENCKETDNGKKR